MYGKWPNQEIDHIDGNKLNNRIDNLRDVSKSINQQNQKIAPVSNKSTKLLGVSRHKHVKGSPYSACITVNKKKIFLGYFDTPELAHSAYIEAKIKLHYGCPREFIVDSYPDLPIFLRKQAA